MMNNSTYMKIDVHATYLPQKKGKIIQKLILWQKSMMSMEI